MAENNATLEGQGAGAAQGEGNQNPPAANDQNNQQGQNNEPKTYTKEELDKLLQAESDKRVTEALKTAGVKFEQEKAAAVEAAKTEAEKLAKMNADQKAEHERQMREKALADREAEITRRELRAQAIESLAEKDLPKELADVLNYTDAEKCKESIEAVAKTFNAALEAAVTERLKGTTPGGQGGDKGGAPNVDLDKMSYAERADFAVKYPEQYKQLKEKKG